MADKRPRERPQAPGDPGSITIDDVARAAGVSVRTASRVLNNSPKVNPTTRARVQQVIRDLSYVPNLRARALASNRSYMLGLIHDDPNAEVADQMQKGIFSVCSRHNYELLVHTCDHKSPDVFDNVMSFVRRSRVDGVVVMAPVAENESIAKALWDNGTPTVGIAAVALERYGLMIVSREREASAAVAEHFVDLGHREIGFVSGPRDQRAAAEREAGFLTALKDRGIHVRHDHICEGDWSFDSGLDCAQRLLSTRVKPTAIYASNDRMAAGILKVAFGREIRVPRDLSVIGFDDSYLATVLNPALTTINRPMVKMGERAAQWLLTTMGPSRSNDQESVLRFYDLTLVKRDSTAAAGKPTQRRARRP